MKKLAVLAQAILALVTVAWAQASAQGDGQELSTAPALAEADSQTFADVPPTHPYYAEIEWLYQNGYTAGCNSNPLMFCPESTMNRAESAVFVERGIHTATFDPPAPSSQVFADVPLNSWAAKWVSGLWQDQDTAGCGTNPLMYCPWQGHTRAEGTVFYLRMMHGATYEPSEPTEQRFVDVPLGVWYTKWVEAAYGAGLIAACQSSPELRFCPEDSLTRGVAAYMMVRAKSVPGRTYYVSPSGNDTNPGTEAQPWRTIQKAANTLVAGDRVEIMQGSYPERIVPLNSGSVEAPIVYRNYRADEVVVNPPNATDSYAIEVNGKSYLEFKGIRLMQSGMSPTSSLNSGIWIRNGSHHIRLDGLQIENNHFGILADGMTGLPVDHITILNSLIAGNGSHGIFFYERVYDSAIGPNNHITMNGPNYSFGVEIGTQYPGLREDGAQRIEVFGNEIDHNDIQGIRTWNARDIWIHDNYLHHNGGTGIQLENGSQGIVVEGNRSEYNSQGYEYETGIWVDGTQNAVVQNNQLRGNKLGLMVTDSSQAILRNNTIVENSQGYGGVANAMGLNVDSGSSEIVAIHNTFYRNGSSGAQRGGVTFCAYHPPGEIIFKNNILSESSSPWDMWVTAGCGGYIADYNNYYNTRALSVKWLGTNCNWTTYQDMSGQDLHSIAGNPQFVDAPAGDFRLQPDSPAIDSGAWLTYTTTSGSGTTVQVDDAGYFTDGTGAGARLIEGDMVKVGTNNPVRVTAVDHAANTITLDTNIAWNAGDGVTYLFVGNGPDIGGYEFSDSR